MKRAVLNWFYTKWTGNPPMAQDYQATFGTVSGQRVLAHLMDNVYCTIYVGSDPVQAAHHTGRRSVVHEILENLDSIENPRKAQYIQEADDGLRRSDIA